jgi:hypothetical protein
MYSLVGGRDDGDGRRVGWVGCPVVVVVTSAGCGSSGGGWWELR